MLHRETIYKKVFLLIVKRDNENLSVKAIIGI